jgi:AraC family transcriptional regulator, arabinose operon regulatory protein
MNFHRKHKGWSQAATMYSLRNGFIYAAPSAFPLWTTRQPAVVLLSLDGSSFRVETCAGRFEGSAMVVAPQIARSIDAQGCGLISLHIEPSHPAFLGLAKLQQERPVVILPHAIFDSFFSALAAIYEARASFEETSQLFDAVVAQSTVHLHTDSRRDCRIAALIDQLVDASPLDYEFGQITSEARLSASRFSHVFTQQGGLSLRSFLMWRKTKEALKLIGCRQSMTEIAHESGFSDSAHFARTIKSTLGVTPSWMADSRCVQVFHWEQG